MVKENLGESSSPFLGISDVWLIEQLLSKLNFSLDHFKHRHTKEPIHTTDVGDYIPASNYSSSVHGLLTLMVQLQLGLMSLRDFLEKIEDTPFKCDDCTTPIISERDYPELEKLVSNLADKFTKNR